MVYKVSFLCPRYHIQFLNHWTVTRTQFPKDSKQHTDIYIAIVYTIFNGVDLSIMKFIDQLHASAVITQSVERSVTSHS